ncbi:MAG: hypothetical protein QOG46_1077 [Pseudonocardiales bacterium]|nr:hypothetical protein [Pseudonocardiales bacterium]
MWRHEEWFAPTPSTEPHAVLELADRLVVDCPIGRHPFFQHAARSGQALRIWVAQELAVTGPFSQLLLALAAEIPNVHIRAMVVEVAYGEHGEPGASIASGSHPWLLEKLRRSMNIPLNELHILPETHVFLTELRDICAMSPLAALGALGIGSEKLLIPEYTAVKMAFEAGSPDCEYETFLDANINDDTWHAVLMSQAAAALINLGGDPDHYLRGAKVSIDARMSYYTSLLASCLEVESSSGAVAVEVN